MPLLLFVALALAGWSCGSTEAKQSGSAGETGDAGAASTASPCSASNAFPIWGKPYDAERDCIDTETHLEAVGCTLQPQEGDDPYYSDGNSCLRRLSDGQEYWAFAYNRLGFDTSIWERCPDARPGIAPKGCYAAGCTEAPRSTCSLEDTKKHYNCSATGEYDENCCGRTPCEGDDDCSAGEECRAVGSAGQWWCWDNPNPLDPGNTCDCGGPYGGPAKMLCMPPAPEPPELGEEEALAGCEGCIRRSIGSPAWEPAQALALVAEIGSLETGPQLYFDWHSEFFGSRHVHSPSETAFLPGEPHDGPYASELAVLAEAAGFSSTQQLSEAEFAPPSGLVLLIMIVPGSEAPQGRSPDFKEGPIIPNELFPIDVMGGVYREGQPYDLGVNDRIVGYDALSEPIDVEGASHFFVSFGENSGFGPADLAPVGDYEFSLRATDVHGTGWELKVPFRVVN